MAIPENTICVAREVIYEKRETKCKVCHQRTYGGDYIYEIRQLRLDGSIGGLLGRTCSDEECAEKAVRKIIEQQSPARYRIALAAKAREEQTDEINWVTQLNPRTMLCRMIYKAYCEMIPENSPGFKDDQFWIPAIRKMEDLLFEHFATRVLFTPGRELEAKIVTTGEVYRGIPTGRKFFLLPSGKYIPMR